MELREIKDKSGNLMPLKLYNGRYFSRHAIGNVKDQLENIQKLTFGPSDVLIWTYPKSGNISPFLIVLSMVMQLFNTFILCVHNLKNMYPLLFPFVQYNAFYIKLVYPGVITYQM